MTWGGSLDVYLSCDGEERLGEQWPAPVYGDDGRITGCAVGFGGVAPEGCPDVPIDLGGMPVGECHALMRDTHTSTRRAAHLAGWRKLDGVDLCPVCVRKLVTAPLGGES